MQYFNMFRLAVEYNMKMRDTGIPKVQIMKTGIKPILSPCYVRDINRGERLSELNISNKSKILG